MDAKLRQKILVTAFSALTARQKDRLRYHLQRKTPIECSDRFADGKGGG